MYAFFIQVLVIGCIYTYTGSIIQNWWRCTTSQSIGLVLGSAWFLLWISLVVFFGITSCVLLDDNKTNTRMLVTTVIHLKQHFDTRYFASCNLSPPRMFSSLDFLSEYRSMIIRSHTTNWNLCNWHLLWLMIMLILESVISHMFSKKSNTYWNGNFYE